MSEPEQANQYLGNGCYAHFDPTDGKRLSLGAPGHEIFLRKETFDALLTFAARIGWLPSTPPVPKPRRGK